MVSVKLSSFRSGKLGLTGRYGRGSDQTSPRVEEALGSDLSPVPVLWNGALWKCTFSGSLTCILFSIASSFPRFPCRWPYQWSYILFRHPPPQFAPLLPLNRFLIRLRTVALSFSPLENSPWQLVLSWRFLHTPIENRLPSQILHRPRAHWRPPFNPSSDTAPIVTATTPPSLAGAFATHCFWQVCPSGYKAR